METGYQPRSQWKSDATVLGLCDHLTWPDLYIELLLVTRSSAVVVIADRPLSGTAMVSMSIYSFKVSNRTAVCFWSLSSVRCFVANWWHIIQQKCLEKWIGSALHGTRLCNFQHLYTNRERHDAQHYHIMISTVLGSDRRSEPNPNPIPNPNPNPSRSEPINFSFNSLLSFRSPIWTYNYPYDNANSVQQSDRLKCSWHELAFRVLMRRNYSFTDAFERCALLSHIIILFRGVMLICYIAIRSVLATTEPQVNIQLNVWRCDARSMRLYSPARQHHGSSLLDSDTKL